MKTKKTKNTPLPNKSLSFDPIIAMLEQQGSYGYSEINHCCDYDYNTHHACNYGSSCCDNDYCRCGVINDARIVSVDLDQLMSALVKKQNLSVIDHYVLDRLVRICELYSKAHWEVNIQSGYYGQEVSGCRGNFEPLIVHLRKINELSGVDKIKYVLEAEYGYLTEFIKTMQAVCVEEVKLSDIDLFNDNHMKKLKHVDIYKDHKLPRAVVRHNGGSRYAIVDGYHRVMAAKQCETIQVLVVS